MSASAPAAPAARRERRSWPGEAVGSYLGLAPATLLFGLFFFVPLAIVACYSFWETVDYRVERNWTFANYEQFFSVGSYVSTMWATLWVSVVATTITVLLAFPFAYWLSRHVPRRARPVLLVLVLIPFWTSYLLRAYSWITILGDKGLLNRFLQWTGIVDHPIGLFLYNRPAVILVLVYLYFPFAVLTLYASIERFDWRQLRAAMDLGARPTTALRRILLPQVRPGIITAVIFVAIPILGEYLTPQIVGGTKGVMIGNLIANFFQVGQFTRGAAASLIIAAFIFLVLAVFRRSLSTPEAYGG